MKDKILNSPRFFPTTLRFHYTAFRPGCLTPCIQLGYLQALTNVLPEIGKIKKVSVEHQTYRNVRRKHSKSQKYKKITGLQENMIIVDVETTGTDPRKHSIVSIGAVDFCDPGNQFYQECRIWNGAEIVKEALDVNGFSEEEIRNANKKSLEETIKNFLKWTENIADRTLAGGNPSFDRDFLKTSAERYGIDWTLGYRSIDLHSLCYTHYLSRNLIPPMKDKRTNLNTDAIFKYVGLPAEPKPHNALTGAKMEAEAFSRLIYKKSLLKEFENYPLPKYLLVDSDETPWEAVIRKIKEEINYNPIDPKLFRVFREKSGDTLIERYIFYQQVDKSIVNQPVLEGQGIELFGNDELKKLPKVSWFKDDFGDDLSAFWDQLSD